MDYNDRDLLVPSRLNYFNYFTEIEDAFVRRRKKHLFLSPLDWALMETWKEQGIPLHIVLRGIERSFDSFESRPRKRSVKSLLYCQEEVEAQFLEWNESRVGGHEESDAEPSDSTTAFSLKAVQDHLKGCSTSIEAIAAARTGPVDLLETLARTSSRLSEIQRDIADGTTFNSRKLEDSLTGLERMLNESMLTSLTGAERTRIETEVKGQIAPYRSQMEKSAYEQTFNNLLMKRVREHFDMPRLSLFYL